MSEDAGGDPGDPAGRPDEPDEVDAAWEDIIANYGERADLAGAPDQAPGDEVGPAGGRPYRSYGPTAEEDPDALDNAWWAQEEHFVPPTPPPAPLPEGARGLAWLGVLGSPVAMLVLVFMRVAIPTWLGLVLFAAFVGGIVYLIAMMPRGDDDDPFSGDDGAVV